MVARSSASVVGFSFRTDDRVDDTRLDAHRERDFDGSVVLGGDSALSKFVDFGVARAADRTLIEDNPDMAVLGLSSLGFIIVADDNDDGSKETAGCAVYCRAEAALTAP